MINTDECYSKEEIEGYLKEFNGYLIHKIISVATSSSS